EKFRNTPPVLGLSMQSVGESMAIGRTFNEALQKGLRSLEIGVYGLEPRSTPPEKMRDLLRNPGPERGFAIRAGLRAGMPVEEIYQLSMVDPWFLREMREIIELEKNPKDLRKLKQNGFSDHHIALITNRTEKEVRDERHRLGIRPVFKRVDTCAA